MATQKQFEAINSAIIEALEAGTVPWRKSWASPAGNQFPHNAITGKRYRGLNVFNLWAVAARNGFESQAWLTEKQALALGGIKKQGSRYQFIQFWKFDKKDTGEIDSKGNHIFKKIFIFNLYKVYNVEQWDGLKLPKRELVDDSKADTFDPIEEAESIINAYLANGGPTVAHNGGDSAYYNPAKHSIHLPKQSLFESKAEYYSTKFHEAVHSTGHETLLGRFKDDTGPVHFGSERYSREELVAEFGNAYLCAEVGIADDTLDNSAAYIQNWLTALKGDYTLALTAASRAQKAADLILSASQELISESEVAA